MKKSPITAMLIGIIFLLYQFLVFLIFGFSGHEETFWCSYAFANVTMVTAVFLMYQMVKKGSYAKTLFYGYSVFAWSGLFVAVQFVITTVFLVIDRYLKAAVLLETLCLVVYIIIILTCFKAKEIIQDVQTQRHASTTNMQLLKTQLTAAETLCSTPVIRQSIAKLREEVTYSDAVTAPETEELEQKMLIQANMLREMCNADEEQTKALCRQMQEILIQRNVICKNAKKH